jgi:hypothetical protein
VPTGKKDPGGGVDVTFVTNEQISEAAGREKGTFAPHWFKSFVVTILEGHSSIGGVVSRTVTTVSQEADNP